MTSLPSAAAADQAVHRINRNSWFLRVVAVLTAMGTLAAVIAFGIVSEHTLQRVQQATDPKSQLSKRAAAQQAQVVRFLILCLENHDDRLAAAGVGRPLPPLMPGCP